MIELPSRLSYSSLSSYIACGERWKLERGYKINGGTWWATIAGSAIHEVTEKWDEATVTNSGAAIPSFADTFAKYKAIEVAKGTTIKASGKVTANIGKMGGPNKKDKAWWLEMGPAYIDRYIAWRDETAWEIPVMPDGNLAIEVRVPVQMGGRDQLGFIDRVFILPDGEVVIVDIKTGAEPASKLQLATYAVALEKLTGIRAGFGAYWMGSTGKLTQMADLTAYSAEYVDAQFEMAWKGIEAGIFLPNVTGMCAGCGVKDYCRAVGGLRSTTIPVTDVLVRRPAQEPRAENVPHVTNV